MKVQALHPCPAHGLNRTTEPVMYQPCTTDRTKPFLTSRSPQHGRVHNPRAVAIADVLLRELGLLPDGD